MAKKYEGSDADEREDRKNAKRAGMSQKQYENSPQDRKADKAGQSKLDKAHSHLKGSKHFSDY